MSRGSSVSDWLLVGRPRLDYQQRNWFFSSHQDRFCGPLGFLSNG